MYSEVRQIGVSTNKTFSAYAILLILIVTLFYVIIIVLEEEGVEVMLYGFKVHFCSKHNLSV